MDFKMVEISEKQLDSLMVETVLNREYEILLARFFREILPTTYEQYDCLKYGDIKKAVSELMNKNEPLSVCAVKEKLTEMKNLA